MKAALPDFSLRLLTMGNPWLGTNSSVNQLAAVWEALCLSFGTSCYWLPSPVGLVGLCGTGPLSLAQTMGREGGKPGCASRIGFSSCVSLDK